MTNLTEQWRKGELLSGWYWVEGSRAEGIYAYTAEYLNNMYRPRNGERIVEQVPTFDEWQASENYIDYLKQCISVYESKEKQHTDDAIAYNELAEENTKLKEQIDDYKRLADMRAEIIARMEDSDNDREKFQNKKIAKLKELLEEAKEVIEWYEADCGYKDAPTENVLAKINQVLGEE